MTWKKKKNPDVKHELEKRPVLESLKNTSKLTGEESDLYIDFYLTVPTALSTVSYETSLHIYFEAQLQQL